MPAKEYIPSGTWKARHRQWVIKLFWCTPGLAESLGHSEQVCRALRYTWKTVPCYWDTLRRIQGTHAGLAQMRLIKGIRWPVFGLKSDHERKTTKANPYHQASVDDT